MHLDEVQGFPHYRERLFEDGDQRQIVAHYTPDAQLVATGLSTVVGRNAIENFWRVAVERTAAAGLRGFVEVSGLGATTVTRYLTVWRQEPDGLRRLAVDISCNEPEAVTATQRQHS